MMSEFNIANYDKVKENIKKVLREILLGEYTDYNCNIEFIGYYNIKTQMAWFGLESSGNYPDVEALPITDDTICTGTFFKTDTENTSIFDFWDSIGEFADTVGMTEEQLIKAVAKEICEGEEEITYFNVRDYVEKHYYDKVVVEHKKIVEENYCVDPFITDTTQDIMFKLEDAIKEELRDNELLPY